MDEPECTAVSTAPSVHGHRWTSLVVASEATANVEHATRREFRPADSPAW